MSAKKFDVTMTSVLNNSSSNSSIDKSLDRVDTVTDVMKSAQSQCTADELTSILSDSSSVQDVAGLSNIIVHSASDYYQQKLKDLLSFNEEMIQYITAWNKEKDPTYEDLQDNLDYLVCLKRRVLDVVSETDIWVKRFLLQPAVKNFLSSILNSKVSYPQCIKHTLQEVVSTKDMSVIIKSGLCSELERVAEWLYNVNDSNKETDVSTSISSFSDYFSLLNNLLELARKAENPISSKTIAKILSKGLYSLRHQYKNTHEDILIILLMHPFTKDMFTDVLTLDNVTPSDLQYLLAIFSQQRLNFDYYKKKGIAYLQSYLTLLCLSVTIGMNERHKLVFLKQLCFVMIELQPPLEKHIHKMIEECFHGSSLEELYESLRNTLMVPCSGRKKFSEHLIPLKSVLQDNLKIVSRALNELCYKKDEFSVLNDNPAAHDVLERLDLCQYYPKKLTVQDALCIRPESLELSLKLKSIGDPIQLPYLILHKLMSYDCLCRADLMSYIHHNATKIEAASEGSDCDDNDDNTDSEDENDMENNLQSNIHPVDCILALLLCSDDFLCQDLLSRLAKCQFAIPFIFPEPFSRELNIPLWGMRSIIKEWKSIENDKIIPHTCPIVEYPMPIVTFIRIGSHLKDGHSKSRIINDVISDAHHDYFFHRDCRGGQYKANFGKGLVDMSWYLPSGSPGDIFPDAVTFLNLHGDGRDFPHQLQFLSKISSMCIVMLTDGEVEIDNSFMIASLNELYCSPGGIIFLNSLEKKQEKWKKHYPKSHRIQLVSKTYRKTAAEIKDAIRARILSKFGQMKTSISIEEACHKKEQIIKIDEDSTQYQKGLEHAIKLKEAVTSCSDNIKETMLPLQGKELWKAWALSDRELYRQAEIGKLSIHEYSEQIKCKKASLRTKQFKRIKNLSLVMKLFIDSLLKLKQENNSNLRKYFLQILKLEFNRLSRQHISEQQHKYQNIRKELSELQIASQEKQTESKDDIKKLQEKLEALQEDIIDSSFGLEHLFRELGQVYEAALHGKQSCFTSKEMDFFLSNLPKIAAELLIEGYPLELMDGDAAHVPLDWVVAVLKETVTLLDDPKVFTMSVLGLQSTGKSTMLNTAFGLQFNVSAGRCTRGAFMQLLKLDESLLTKTRCKYVLVVDTEGLRAPELDPQKTQKHDNELATFVIGLANMTLINIYGEVPGDMDDILQTSVHAFLRMTEVRYYPSCQFVHQNAGVNIKGEVGKAKFTQKLDQFTKDAAREEQCEGKFETFNDVIKFNDQTDVHYFPGLWNGVPPMAPVSEGYSQNAQILKHQLIKVITERASLNVSSQERVGDLSLSSFHVKIKDLWATLLREKFVFSFKNTLEITAYNSLETAYGKWDWHLQSSMLKWEQEAENEIKTEPIASIGSLVEKKIKEVKSFVYGKLYEPLKEEMEEFFNGKQSEILIQWKKRFEIRLENLVKELVDHAEKHCTKLLEGHQAISEFEANQQKNEKIMLAKMQEYIMQLNKTQENLQKSLETRNLEPDQLKELLKQNLFSSENLSLFIEQAVLTEDQVKQITQIKLNDEGTLSATSLKRILEGEMLTLDQVRKIIKKAQKTEAELKVQFDIIWKELLLKLPSVKSSTHISVAYEVEKALMKFVDSRGYYGQMIAKLQKQSLNEWGNYNEFRPKQDIHYVRKNSFVENLKKIGRKMWGTSDPCEIQAIEVTKEVFSEARAYIDEVTKEDTDFKVAFVYKLLWLVDEMITFRSNNIGSSITFVPEYRLDVYVTICGNAVPNFETMVKVFEAKNDPRLHLETKFKDPLFIQFKNQYYRTVAEEAIADSICGYLQQPVKVHVESLLAIEMVTKMKTEYYFCTKKALKAKIIEDLYKEKNFEECIQYLEDVRNYIQTKVLKCSEKFCDSPITGSADTVLQSSAKEEVSKTIEKIKKVVTNTVETDAKRWLLSVCGDNTFRKVLGVTLNVDGILAGYKSEEINLSSFKECVIDGLEQLKLKIQQLFSNVEYRTFPWKDKSPSDHCQSVLVGCTEQCPFCKEHCDLLEHDDSKDHRTEVHRVSCLAGYRYHWNGQMATDICPSLIDSDYSFWKPGGGFHPCKNYKEIHSSWSINYDALSENCSFWKWFVGAFQCQLEEKFDTKPSNIPDHWSKITWDTIRQDLNTAYNVTL